MSLVNGAANRMDFSESFHISFSIRPVTSTETCFRRGRETSIEMWGKVMYSDYEKKVNAMQRGMRRNTRIACFVGASLLHFVASTMLLALQTSCAYPWCVDGIAFAIFRAIMHVPLFLTPWLGLPSPELDYVRDPMLALFMVLNAVLAVALYWGVAILGYRVLRYRRARQWKKLVAAQRAR